MQLAHFAHEVALGGAHVEQRLAGLRLGIEDHEIHRMALAQRDAHLRVVLEAADAGAVAGARVDDDVGPPFRVYRYALRRNDAHQRVVDRLLERAAIQYRLVVEMEKRRFPGALVLHEDVAALAQRVPEEHRALREIERVIVAGFPHAPRGYRQLGRFSRLAGLRGIAHARGEPVLRHLQPLLEQHPAFCRQIGGPGKLVG